MQLSFDAANIGMRVRLDADTLGFEVSHRAKTWKTLAGFRPYVEYLPLGARKPQDALKRGNQTSLFFQGEKLYFDQAGQIAHQPFQTGVGRGVSSTFKGFSSGGAPIPLELETRLWLEETTGVLHIELIPRVDDPGVLRVIFPAPFALSERSAACATVLSLMQGCLLPNDWKQDLWTFSAGLCYSRAAYMPWWGQLDGQAGCISIFDTPWDAGYWMEHPSGGPTLLYPVWHASLGSIGYTRKLQIHFAGGNYNDLAKIYRAYARERGLVRTLAEKAAAKPAVTQLIGSPVVHTGICVNIQPESTYFNSEDPSVNWSVTPFGERAAQLEELKRKGVEKAYVHLDGWGRRGYDNLHPDVLPPCEAAGGWEGMRGLVDTCHGLGYLIITHDQYRDYYKDAATYDPQQAVHNECGQVPDESVWYGGAQAFLCARNAPYYVRRNWTALQGNGVHLDGAYLDVFAVVELDECFHPQHRMTRRECMQARGESFACLGNNGFITSSEEAIDWSVPYLELYHHGPYALEGSFEDGPAMGLPIPLFNLVYHDCVVLPWTLTTGGWGIPRGDSGLLHAYLNGGTGYLSIDAGAEEIDRVLKLCAFQQRVAHAELLRHEFVDGNPRRQRAVYANGVQVEVDFETSTFHIQG
jgi:hypothetical protein